MDNADVARVLDEIADLLEIGGANAFRVRAYRTAARTIESHAEPVAKIVARDRAELCELHGIGKDLAGKIAEIVETGDLGLRRELVASIPPSLATMMHVAGIGPKRAKLFYDRLGIRSIDELAAAARAGKLHEVRGVGEALEKKIVQGCEEERRRSGRFLLSEADAHADALIEWMRGDRAALEVSLAGSARRRRETIGDLDVLVAARDARAVAERFCRFPDAVEVVAHGETKCTVVLRSGMHADLRVVEPACFGAALHYFTGSKAHNIAVRKLGVRKKLKISEYGVFRGEKRIGGRTEREVFEAVGLPWIPPELREDRGEIEAARDGSLPRLVELDAIRGDLHVHTDATDGKDSLEDMVEACRARGYAYVAITDHTKRLAMTGGLDRAGLRAQRRAIQALQRKTRGIRILHGAEVDVLEDGSLDLDDETLADLDLVIAAVHSKLDMPEAEMTARVIAAIRNPCVTILAHPTGRLLGKREPVAIDLGKVVAAARDRGVWLEIDAQPERLDLGDTMARMARDAGVTLVVDSDAHSVSELAYLRYGVDVARRAWCTAADVANTRTAFAPRRMERPMLSLRA